MKRIISFLMIAVMLSSIFTVFSAFPASAAEEDSDVRYTQKVVAVIFDNSGSMRWEDERIPSAKYSMGLLMSLLDERDQMRIIPMNECPTDEDGNVKGIEIDLSTSKREEELDKVFEEYNDILAPIGDVTPKDSMANAISILEKEYGLKDEEHLIESEVDKEYWLVILTDGLFEDNPEVGEQAQYIIEAIEKYPTLHPVYVSFGSDAPDLTSRPELGHFPFLTTHCKVPVKSDSDNNLVSVMQEIANQITGRYPLGDTQYTVSDNTVTIDLTQIPFSVSSVSVIAQNCGATVKSVKYDNPIMEGKAPDVKLDKVCTIKPDAALGLLEGCSFKTVTDRHLFGGTLTYEFSGPVVIDQLSIFAEPVLDINTYIEGNVNGAPGKVDAQYINENMGKGDKIRVKYEVVEPVSGVPVDLEKVFGTVESSVVYKQTPYEIGEDIPLEIGSNELAVEIVLMDGAFSIRRSELITVEADPTYFRIETDGEETVSGASPTAAATFTVFVNNAPATKDILSAYDCNLIAKKSDGSVIFDRKVEPEEDGKIKASLKLDTNSFDVYTFELTVKTPEFLKRTKAHNVTYIPSELKISTGETEHMTLTQEQIKFNTKNFVFELSANGQPFPFNNGLTSFKLTAGNLDLTSFAKIENNKLVFTPTADNMEAYATTPGDVELNLSLTSESYPNLATEASVKLTVENTVYEVATVESTNKSIDRFDLENCEAVLYFSVLKDGVPFTEGELNEALESGMLKVTTSPLFNFFLFPAGADISTTTIAGTPVIAVKAEKDMGNYLAWHFSAFIKGGDKLVTATYNETVSAEDHFTVIPSSIWQHILRITLLILEIAFYIYLLLYIAGLIISFVPTIPFVKPLPRGAFVEISPSGESEITSINVNVMELVKWHLIRLIPWKLFVNQPIESQAPFCDGLEFLHTKQSPGSITIQLEETTSGYLHRPYVTPSHEESFNAFKASIRLGKGDIDGDNLKDILDDAYLNANDMYDITDSVPIVPPNAIRASSSLLAFYAVDAMGGNERFRYAIFFKAL